MLEITVLGEPSRDNALLVTADSGQSLTRLLFDCGGQTLDALPLSDIQAIDHLFFSHLHMDHIAGFDAFFRANFDRLSRPNHLWGPPETARILSHRLRGYWWNHAPQMQGTWRIHEVGERTVQTWRFELSEAFETAHFEDEKPRPQPLLDLATLTVDVLDLQHQGHSLGYVVREAGRLRVDTQALTRLGLKPGPWLAQLKSGADMVDPGTGLQDTAQLRTELLTEEAGDSLAYLTDFLLDEAELSRLAPLLRGIRALYTEAQYAPEDSELAARNHHTTTVQVARLAAQAEAEALTLLHLSRRYRPDDWRAMRQAAQVIFPAAQFPAEWSI